MDSNSQQHLMNETPQQTTSRPCYICGETGNRIIAIEPVEQRFGRPLMPERVYRFARCRRCSTLYVDSDVTDEYLKGIYVDETTESACEAAGGGEPAQLVSCRLPEFHSHWAHIKKIRPPAPGDRLLDLGCQTGDFGALVQREGVQPDGIELSKSYAEVCREVWGGNSQVYCGTVMDAPFMTGQFQYITCFETLEHMCDPIETLGRLRTWLAPDGVLALSVPSSDYFHFKYWLLRKSPLARVAKQVLEKRSGFYRNQVLPHTHIYNFSHTSVRLLAQRASLQPVLIALTGWHGGVGSVLHVLGRALEIVSKPRIGFAPSLFAVAKPMPPQR